MANRHIISDSYTVDPNQIKYDEKISGFNNSKTASEYAGLVAQIRESGQTQPAYMRNGLLGDGVHRAKACMQLGIKLSVVDIDPTITDKDYIVLCNENTFAARNDSPAQSAIKGFKLVAMYGHSDAAVVKMLGLTDKKAIGYVRTIEASRLNDRYKILETLASKREAKVQIGDKWTGSLDTAKRLVSKIEEMEANDGILEVVNPTVDYDSMLHTETAKEYFWNWHSHLEGYDVKLHYIGLLNEVYKIPRKVTV